jgi:Ankyrin repeats (3 copies)
MYSGDPTNIENIALDRFNKALYSEVEANNLDAVRRILATGRVDVNATHDDSRRTALHIAAQNGNAEIVACLLAAGATVSAVDSNDETPLIYAAKEGHRIIVDQLRAALAAARAVRVGVGISTPAASATLGGRSISIGGLFAAARAGVVVSTPLPTSEGRRVSLSKLFAAARADADSARGAPRSEGDDPTSNP